MITVDLLSGRLISVPTPTGGTGGGSSELDVAEIGAAEDIAALQLITSSGQVADSSNLAHFNRVIGIVMVATLTGFIAEAVVEGEVSDPSWAWGGGAKLFLNGTSLSATPPSSGFSQLVGVARNSQVVFIRLQVPVLL